MARSMSRGVCEWVALTPQLLDAYTCSASNSGIVMATCFVWTCGHRAMHIVCTCTCLLVAIHVPLLADRPSMSQGRGGG